jgi:hypothetical protein
VAQLQRNIDFALNAHPGPWKVRTRQTGARQRQAFPWEVIDATGNTVALVPSGQVGCLLAASVRIDEPEAA